MSTEKDNAWVPVAKGDLESIGYVVIKGASYRRAQERLRVAQALLACQEQHNEHTRQWAHEAHVEQRRLADRLNFVYGVARAHGATVEELDGPTSPQERAS